MSIRIFLLFLFRLMLIIGFCFLVVLMEGLDF